MSDALSKNRARSLDLKRDLLRSAGEKPSEARQFGGFQTASYLPGDRVFDTVSGMEGEVLAYTTENVVVPTPER